MKVRSKAQFAGRHVMAMVAASWMALGATGAWAEARMALVIGVSNYKPPIPPLSNPTKDAAFVAEALKKEGFKVETLNNPTRTELLEAFQSFSERSENAEAAIVYYAGHGVEVDGINYLLPQDAKAPRETRRSSANAGPGGDTEVSRATKALFTDTAVQAQRARDSLVGATRVRLLILDACREDPFAASSRAIGGAGGGLARETGGSATRVVTLMAAAPGKVAYDGEGTRNSPFAEALVSAIRRPGMTIGDLPITVQMAVEEATRNEESPQSPDQQGIFRDTRWMFSSVTTTTKGPSDAEAVAQQRLAREKAFWDTAKDSTDPADLKAYVDKVDAGEFSGLFKPLALNRMRSLEKQQAPQQVASRSATPAAPTVSRTVPAAAAPVTVASAPMPAPAGAASARTRGREAYLRGDYKAASAAWNEAARAGDSAGAYNLGVMALTGRGGPKDLAAAARWFKQAGDAGHPGAMQNYALCLLNGYGVTKNEAQAVQYLRKAADAGLPAGMALIGEVYLQGVGVKADPKQGAAWLNKAVEAGDGPALVRLAGLYEEGVGVRPDLKKAFDLYRRGALAGQADAMVRVGYFYEDGAIEQPDLLQAATWYQRAADAGDPEGMSSLGVMLENGRGLVQDEAAALKYYQLAADKNDARGYLGLGGMYARGAGTRKDEGKAVTYFRQAAEGGSAAGARNLGIMYELGRGVPRDLSKAAQYYRQAAEGGESEAAADLARVTGR